MFLEILRDLTYNHKLSEAAEEALNAKNWSALFSIFLQRINMQQNGIFDTTLKKELASITALMVKMFPGVPIFRRLFTQYCVMLASWR